MEHLKPQTTKGPAAFLYQRMIEEIQDYAIILLDRDGFIQNWNKGAEKIKLYKEEEIIGKHFSIFYLPEDVKDRLPYRLIDIARTTGRANHEGWRKRSDDTRFWGSVTITAVHDDVGEVIGFAKVTRDLTERKAAEDELRRSEERYHHMVAEVQDYAIILLNIEGEIQNWNAGARKIKGYEESEVLGRKFEIFYTPEDRAVGLPSKLLEQARETGKAVQEGWRVRKDGTRFWGTIVITALHGKDGELIGFSKVTRDLTEKKMDEQKMLAYMHELEVQNGELEQFAYVASHDLQEPLRKIQTFSEMIRDNYGDEVFVRRYLQKLEASAMRMSALVKSLLNYSRLSHDKGETTVVDLNETLLSIKTDFELLLAEKHAVIDSDRLPQVTGNATQLGQLFGNLISNALKFSGDDTRIEIRAAIVTAGEIPGKPENLVHDKFARISVKDNGIGFEQQYEKKIFALFQRLHGKDSYAGTGIGLALCKKIVENHNGYITAFGELNKGATFVVYLPV
jgi:PAS domain S-box-containing protein